MATLAPVIDDNNDNNNNNNNNNNATLNDQNTTPLLSDLSPLLLPGDRRHLLNVAIDDDEHYEIHQRTPFMESPGVFFRERFQAGSVKGSVFTLVVAIVGAGTLAVPFAIEASGLLLGSVLFIGGALVSLFSLRLLLLASHLTGAMSYKNIALRTWGPKTSVFTQVMLLINLFGTTIMYLVAAGTMVSKALSIMSGIKREDSFWLSQGTVTAIVTVCPALPLSLLKTMGALRFSSLFAVACVAYLCVVVVAKYVFMCTEHQIVHSIDRDGVTHAREVTCFWNTSSSAGGPDVEPIVLADLNFERVISAVPIIVYAYTCHPNVLPVLMELRLPNQRRMLKVMWRAIGIACSVYVITGSFAYLTFGSQLQDSGGNFLENDYHNDPAVLFGMIAMACAVCLAIPLLVHAFRNNMFNLIYPGSSAAHDMSSLFRVSVTVVMMTLCLVVAVTVSDISRICTVLGATSNPIICFALPAAFFIKASPKGQNVPDKIFSVIVTVAVMFVSAWTLSEHISSWASGGA